MLLYYKNMDCVYAFILIILINKLPFTRPSDDDGKLKYESAENACTRCKCVTENAVVPPISHYILNCANKGFKQILGDYPNEFGEIPSDKEIDISFSGNAIKRLQPLPQTQAIVFFSCRHCQLNEISTGVFQKVLNILRLDLSWNDLTDDALRPDIFRGNYNDDLLYEPVNLEDLDLANNKFKSLDYRLFEHTPNIKRLSFAYNQFGKQLDDTTIAALTSIPKVEHLDLSYIGLENLPDILFNRTMPKLRELLVQGNRFLMIPESIASLGSSLRSLYIGGNSITTLTDESFLGLKGLTHLFIGDMNDLEIIENSTFSFLISLEVLNCRNNTKLNRFDLGGLISSLHLRELDLSNCALKTLDITIPRDTHFESTDGNPETEIFELAKLRLFKLQGNPWHCDCAIFKSLQKLKHYGSDEFHSDDEARCSTPYDLSGTLLSDLSKLSICTVGEHKQPPYIPYEPPAFLRPRAILLTLLSILAVVIIGLIVGCAIVQIKKRLRKNELGAGSPIRYTTVRNSTMSVQA